MKKKLIKILMHDTHANNVNPTEKTLGEENLEES